jgi:hypothetical protein
MSKATTFSRARPTSWCATDFVGNVALKTSEGLASMIGGFLKEEFSRNIFTKIAAIVAYPVLSALKNRMDYRRYNGAALLGLRGLVFKSHGSADEMAFEQALNRAYDAARNNLLDRVQARIAHAAPLLWRRRRRPPAMAPRPGAFTMRRYSRITGTGSYLPPRRVTNADLVAELAARGVETSDDWIVERTGIRARHFAAPDVACSDLAVPERRAMRWQAPAAQPRRHRPDHRGHLHARHGVPVHRLHPAAQAGHAGLPGV